MEDPASSGCAAAAAGRVHVQIGFVTLCSSPISFRGARRQGKTSTRDSHSVRRATARLAERAAAIADRRHGVDDASGEGVSRRSVLALCSVLFLSVGCSGGSGDGAPDRALAQLGEQVFHDANLSQPAGLSCASCPRLGAWLRRSASRRGFQTARRAGPQGFRNAPSREKGGGGPFFRGGPPYFYLPRGGWGFFFFFFFFPPP